VITETELYAMVTKCNNSFPIWNKGFAVCPHFYRKDIKKPDISVRLQCFVYFRV